MLADIAVANGAEQCVGQRVQHHVGVGMAVEALASCGILTPPSQT